MATISGRSRQNLDSVHPELGLAVTQALRHAPGWLDFGVISGKRTVEEQQELFAKGRDADGNIVGDVVTYADGLHKKSRHQSGRAIDIVAYVKGEVSWDEDEIAKRAAYILGFARAKGLRLTGGLYWGWDLGHLEMEDF